MRRGAFFLCAAWEVPVRRRCIILASAAAALTLSAAADVVYLKSGGSVEGKVVEQTATGYTIRTAVGMIRLPADAVQRVEEKPSILDEYIARREQLADTAAAHVELARWCQEQGLTAAQRTHLKRALELDPDCEAARAALGYVRVGGLWVDGRARGTGGGGAPDGKDADRHKAGADDEAVVAAIQTQWTVRIRAIRDTKLESPIPRAVREGRERILEIQDPLAILPMARLLSEGSLACREVLVEALGRFSQDEATMNLAVLALVDADDGIRHRALLELKRRDHPDVIPQFRRALVSGNDALVRRAAVGLGVLEARAAVPELIDALQAQRRKLVEVPVRTYFLDYPMVFSEPTVTTLGGGVSIRHVPALGIDSLGLDLVFVDRRFELRDVIVYRSEVREALRRITGQDFGFDQAAWQRWYAEEEP